MESFNIKRPGCWRGDAECGRRVGSVGGECRKRSAKRLPGANGSRCLVCAGTIRDCATGVALAPAVNSLVTFAAGGTLHESVSGGGFAPGQRNDGHGTWAHNGGRAD